MRTDLTDWKGVPMRELINYIRSCFCEHEWECILRTKFTEDDDALPTKLIWVYRCKKCGYAQKIEIP